MDMYLNVVLAILLSFAVQMDQFVLDYDLFVDQD
jgi:hypothetical protein